MTTAINQSTKDRSDKIFARCVYLGTAAIELALIALAYFLLR